MNIGGNIYRSLEACVNPSQEETDTLNDEIMYRVKQNKTRETVEPLQLIILRSDRFEPYVIEIPRDTAQFCVYCKLKPSDSIEFKDTSSAD